MNTAERASRREKLLGELIDSDAPVPGLLVSGRVNVRYLSGFSGSNGWLLVTAAEEPILLTDGRYRAQAASEAPACRLVICSDGLAQGVAGLPALPDRLAFESAHLSNAAATELRQVVEHSRWTPTSGLVESLRARKSPLEIEAIRAALELAERVLAETVSWMTEGCTEVELAAEIDYRCRRRGARRMAFDTIVAAGPRGALPHASPTAAPIPTGTPVVVDMGCELDGYCSDITRCVVLGDDLAPEWRDIHRAVDEARQAAIDAIRPGVAAAEVDGVARRALAASGLEEAFVHGLGHGVGMEVHEAPRLAARSDDVLDTGMVVTVEPGVYLEGRGGIRLEDLVVVGEAGGERLNELGEAPLKEPGNV